MNLADAFHHMSREDLKECICNAVLVFIACLVIGQILCWLVNRLERRR